MNVKKPLVVAGVASTLAVGGVSGLGVVSAATNDSATSDNPMSSLVDAIASKFHLNKSDVQAVVHADRQQHEAEREKRQAAELDKLVTDGKLTSSQKDLIVAKQAEVKTFMDSLKDKSETDRRTAMKTERTQLEAWAKQNNLPAADLRFVLPFGPGGPGGMHGPDGPAPGDSSSNSSNSSSSSN
ncbi:MAG TPA: hypothetical protein VG604_04675 [Candidatus Saccharimonadales bacterium]|nr:hypothetical protein [Candidatus Saccharimonadales bacterium]